MSSQPLPRLAVSAANAATILGVSKETFQGLVDAGQIRPLPYLGTYAVSDLEGLIHALKKEQNSTNGTHIQGDQDHREAPQEREDRGEMDVREEAVLLLRQNVGGCSGKRHPSIEARPGRPRSRKPGAA